MIHPSIVINESIELAKKIWYDRFVFRFINGILDQTAKGTLQGPFILRGNVFAGDDLWIVD